MRDLDVLVPSALLPSSSTAPDLARELLRDLSLPTLSRVFAHASRTVLFAQAPDAALTTWQSWLFERSSGRDIDLVAPSVNVAELWAAACGIGPAPDAAPRWLLEPAHFQIARDHLRLTDPAQIDFTLAEARALAAAAEPILAEAGWRLEPLEPATRRHWLAERTDWATVSGAAIERAIGDNVAAWQPRSRIPTMPDEVALSWRRCVNEIQMAWFAHPVNEAREARGQAAVNTLWLSGNGGARTVLPRYAAVETGLPLVASLQIDPDAMRALETFDDFIAPARQDEWGVWREALQAFDARLAGIVALQDAGKLRTVTLVLCGRDHGRLVTLARGDLRRFWRGWLKRVAPVDRLVEPTPP